MEEIQNCACGHESATHDGGYCAAPVEGGFCGCHAFTDAAPAAPAESPAPAEPKTDQ